MWDKMVSFGRYCFNKSHAVGYMLIAYRCLWLKTHFPSEWWAATLSECPSIRMVRYMGSARAEGIQFGSIDVNHLTVGFSVDDEKVIPGVSTIKGIGKISAKLVEESQKEPFKDVDDFVARCGKSKTVLERLIKLGGFDKVHPNRKALWMYYQYKHGSGKDITMLKRQLNHCYVWPQKEIETERARQIAEFTRLYPKRKKIPNKVLQWLPSKPVENPSEFNPDLELTAEQVKIAKKLQLNFEQIAALFPKDYKLAELLEFEKEFLGYYWNSPLNMFHHNEKTTIEHAKTSGLLECVIEEVHQRQGQRGKYMILNVTDGINTARVNVWGDILACNDEEYFEEGRGVRMLVKWQDRWRSFSVKNNTNVMLLESAED
jgi:DNA polymerase III alpha subunit